MMHRSERRDVAPKAALTLRIAFNELATNAVKYGALSNAAGSILIEWTIEAAPGCKSVTSAATVEKALALINAQVFDVALLDMNLDGSDSHPVAEALSAHGSTVCLFDRQHRSRFERRLLRSARAKKAIQI
jgi:two-component sensor histidine kinase